MEVESLRVNDDSFYLIGDALSLNDDLPRVNGDTWSLTREAPTLNDETWNLNADTWSFIGEAGNLTVGAWQLQRRHSKTHPSVCGSHLPERGLSPIRSAGPVETRPNIARSSGLADVLRVETTRAPVKQEHPRKISLFDPRPTLT